MEDKKEWTPDQKKAIGFRGNSLLVSAAAGSGKTAVLVERLLREIDEGSDITRFLVITYTKAAASELRTKIGKALRKRASQNPENAKLRRQLALVSGAHISTVHSFCSWLLRNYSQEPALSGGFRVLDENEARFILNEQCEEMINEKYEENDASFLALANYLAGAKSDKKLAKTVTELFSGAQTHPYPEKWLQKVKSSYDIAEDAKTEETPWGRYIIENVNEILDFAITAYKSMLEDAEKNTEVGQKNIEALSDTLSDLISKKSQNWDELYKNFENYKPGTFRAPNGMGERESVKRIKAVKKRADTRLGKISELIPSPSDEMLGEMRAMAPLVNALCDLAEELAKRFSKEKQARSALDYSDLEHYAIKLLVESYDEKTDTVFPTDTARDVAAMFDELLLDEFQDSNAVQDMIFRAVSQGEKNIVMVGDVKQSIYKFRLADPSIFMKKYKRFKNENSPENRGERCVMLSQNFRSRKEIIDAANALFSCVMTEETGGVNYSDGHELHERENIPQIENSDMRCEFNIIESGDIKENEAEALYAAQKIEELVRSGFRIVDADGAERPCEYKDFAILLRSKATKAELYEKALHAAGIPYVSPIEDDLLSKSEVSTIISLLTVINNPTSDIQLAAVLRSPLFAFSADELCYVRRKSASTLIYAVEQLSKEEGETAKKCRRFLKLVSELRTLSRGVSASELIWEIYNKTNALGVFGAQSFGEERQRNLMDFYRCAGGFESAGYYGLYKFLTHIASLANQGGTVPASSADPKNAVSIMTVHKSKGLEFPIVMLPNSVYRFNTEDTKGDILIHPEYGIGLSFTDEENMCKTPNLAQIAIKEVITSENISEELRVLYVAMTRAREKMYMTTADKDPIKYVSDILERNAYPELDAYTYGTCGETKSWILLPLLRTASGNGLREKTDAFLKSGDETVKTGYVSLSAKERESKEEKTPETDADIKKISEMLSFEYPSETAKETPSKITATGMSHAKNGEKAPVRKRTPRPRFMLERSLNAAERGTALHLAMQFADLSKCTSRESTVSELSRLYQKKFLSEQQYKAIDPQKILNFTQSETGKKMRAAKYLRREFKFSVLVPANEVLESEELGGEKLLLQGVMDMYFEDEDGVTIVDFKTDSRPPDEETLEKYGAQLKTYRRALYEMTGKRAKRLVLFFVSQNKTIEI